MDRNSFVITEENGKFKSQSLNLSDCVGYGKTEQEALDDMVKKLMYVRDNDKPRWIGMIRKQIKDLKAKGEIPIMIYNGKL